MKLVAILGFHLTLIFVVKSLSHSYFSKSSIIINTCNSDNLIKNVTVQHRFQCSAVCSQDTDCRRYLYCESDLSCKTYLDGTDCILSDNSGDCSCYRKDIGCTGGMCTCPLGYYGNKCENIIKDCLEGFAANVHRGHKKHLLTFIQPGSTPFEIICDYNFHGIMRILGRDKSCLFQNFNKTMQEYRNGFGIVPNNRWIGLERIYEIINTPADPPSFNIIVYMIRSDDSYCQTYFYNFDLSDAGTGYRINYDTSLHNSDFGGCGIPFGRNRFSTIDDDRTGSKSCPRTYGGGWWFNEDPAVDCTNGFFTGTMNGSGVDNYLLDDPHSQPYSEIYVMLGIW
ncbi:hypothetical protein SNE40_020754 [Patella caerulea]|uniref:Fibrinogen C-terminal domain-containing protein n=1 Tax=Patella caerulea TaxID=87958 RepID=A0AAN8J5G3_PATCE